MAKPLDHDLRIRLVAAVEGCMSCQAAARQFLVDDSTVIRLMDRYREIGRVARARRGMRLDPAPAADQSDITIRILADDLVERGIRVSQAAESF